MSRSVKKGPFVEERLYSRIQSMNESGKKTVVKTWSRASTIFPDFVGHSPRGHRESDTTEQPNSNSKNARTPLRVKT